jgi:hypothetical protein
MRQPGVEPGAKAWEASMLPIHHWRGHTEACEMQRHSIAQSAPGQNMVWRSRVSIPVPADCEPTALPSELHPRLCAEAGHSKKIEVVQAMGFEPMPLARLAPKASALTTRPNLQRSGERRTIKKIGQPQR